MNSALTEGPFRSERPPFVSPMRTLVLRRRPFTPPFVRTRETIQNRGWTRRVRLRWLLYFHVSGTLDFSGECVHFVYAAGGSYSHQALIDGDRGLAGV